MSNNRTDKIPEVFVYFNDEIVIVAPTIGYEFLRGPKTPSTMFSVPPTESDVASTVLAELANCEFVENESDMDVAIGEFFRFNEIGDWDDLQKRFDHFTVRVLDGSKLMITYYEKRGPDGYLTENSPETIARSHLAVEDCIRKIFGS